MICLTVQKSDDHSRTTNNSTSSQDVKGQGHNYQDRGTKHRTRNGAISLSELSQVQKESTINTVDYRGCVINTYTL